MSVRRGDVRATTFKPRNLLFKGLLEVIVDSFNCFGGKDLMVEISVGEFRACVEQSPERFIFLLYGGISSNGLLVISIYTVGNPWDKDLQSFLVLQSLGIIRWIICSVLVCFDRRFGCSCFRDLLGVKWCKGDRKKHLYLLPKENYRKMEGMLTKWSSLKIHPGETEIVEGDLLRQHPCSSDIDNAVFGKIWHPTRISAKTLLSFLVHLWKPKAHFRVNDMGKNKFTIFFTSACDMRNILANRPWHFHNRLLTIMPIDPTIHIDEHDPRKIKIWVGIHNLPMMYFNKESAIILGNKVGVFVSCPEKFSPLSTKVLKVRVEIDILDPLCRILVIKDGHKDRCCRLSYDNLPHFCFRCGRMDHMLIECQTKKAVKEEPERYGAWLRSEYAGSIVALTEDFLMNQNIKLLLEAEAEKGIKVLDFHDISKGVKGKDILVSPGMLNESQDDHGVVDKGNITNLGSDVILSNVNMTGMLNSSTLGEDRVLGQLSLKAPFLKTTTDDSKLGDKGLGEAEYYEELAQIDLLQAPEVPPGFEPKEKIDISKRDFYQAFDWASALDSFSANLPKKSKSSGPDLADINMSISQIMQEAEDKGRNNSSQVLISKEEEFSIGKSLQRECKGIAFNSGKKDKVLTLKIKRRKSGTPKSLAATPSVKEGIIKDSKEKSQPQSQADLAQKQGCQEK